MGWTSLDRQILERIKVIEVIPTSEKIVYPIGITQNTEKLAQASHFVDFIFSITCVEDKPVSSKSRDFFHNDGSVTF